ncbi:hypothetical protein QF038_004235 [Pseudarthrobacter sp. W1I19]|nr:hypothetical protein [Pseudarthrobacter sp. W1I19]
MKEPGCPHRYPQLYPPAVRSLNMVSQIDSLPFICLSARQPLSPWGQRMGSIVRLRSPTLKMQSVLRPTLSSAYWPIRPVKLPTKNLYTTSEGTPRRCQCAYRARPSSAVLTSAHHGWHYPRSAPWPRNTSPALTGHEATQPEGLRQHHLIPGRPPCARSSTAKAKRVVPPKPVGDQGSCRLHSFEPLKQLDRQNQA